MYLSRDRQYGIVLSSGKRILKQHLRRRVVDGNKAGDNRFLPVGVKELDKKNIGSVTNPMRIQIIVPRVRPFRFIIGVSVIK